MLEFLIYLLTALLLVGVPLAYILRERRRSSRAAETLQRAVERGLDEPPSLHPFIDPDRCIGVGACAKACPESGILGLINNRAALINPARCIGHGQCQELCPVDAITLVFGTEKRGIDIPYLTGRFETNVPGIYIAGELGGMGLIRNAVKQGREAMDYMAESLDERHMPGIYDAAIIGAGPAGIAASLQAKKANLSFVTVDQEDLGGTILTYPRQKLVMTQPMEFPLFGKLSAGQIQKEDLLEIFHEICSKTELQVRVGEKASEVEREHGVFHVVTNRGTYAAQRVLLAIGRRGSPRKLGVPGERSSKVTYRLLEPEKYTNLGILIVGGGDSAVEAACALAEQPGNTVHLSYRREALFRIKEENRHRFDNAVEAGRIMPIYNSQVVRIDPDTVTLVRSDEEFSLSNDQVFVFAGGEVPTSFLMKLGIEVTKKFGEP